jgi:acyl-CoA thioester hydrolase
LGFSDPVIATVRVIFGDTDQMGVVYYANYLRYFELSRSEFFRARGGSYTEMEKQGFGLPVAEAFVRYHAPARYDELIEIEVRLAELNRASMRFEYEVRRREPGAPGSQAVVLCTGHTVQACVGPNGRPTRLPDWVTKLLRPNAQTV